MLAGRVATDAVEALEGRCLVVRHPVRPNAVAHSGDVVLLDLFAELPRLAAPDSQERVDLAGVVLPVPGDDDEDLSERERAAPVDRMFGVEVVELVE